MSVAVIYEDMVSNVVCRCFLICIQLRSDYICGIDDHHCLNFLFLPCHYDRYMYSDVNL